MKLGFVARCGTAARCAPLAGALAFGVAVTSVARDVGGERPQRLALPSSLERTRHVVILRDAALASYRGGVRGHPAPAYRTSGPRQGRVDIASPAARAYLELLAQAQRSFLDDATTALGRAPVVRAQLRHALNAVIVDVTDAEAAQLAQRAGVRFVERERTLDFATDRGPSFIGAPAIWNGTATGVATRGAGVVVAVIDSGINWRSPAFAAVGPVDGYVHVNPLGAGQYLGLCGPTPPNADIGRCNDKLIGLYNFASDAPTRSATDASGHGSHTASTAAGNAWNAPFGGGTFAISGVAPHANVIAYRVCDGTCTSTAVVQATNQTVADGVVDVVNFSISGGASPWGDATSLAFLGAHDAGLFVAAAAGNSGPLAGSADHQEPWVQTVAASSHDRVLGFDLDADVAGAPPATQNVALRPGAAPVQASDLGRVPIVRSPGFANGSTDGCTSTGGYAGGTFARPYAPPADRVFGDAFEATPPPPAGAIAVVAIDAADSACGSVERQTNAVAAGAVGVIFVDAEYVSLGASGNAWSLRRAQWDALYALLPANATVSITRPARAYAGTGDVVADFSSRGPRTLANDHWLVKPDIAAPGVDVLAAWRAGDAPHANATALENGTSMASPHVAGAAALLRALHPAWTPVEVKSALTLTATTTVVTTGGAPADPWARGAGRVDVAAAARAGLVLDETGANFLAADPGAGGDVAALNLPSIASARCVGPCTFARTLRRTAAGVQTYTVGTSGFPAGLAAATPASFTIGAGATRTVIFTVQSHQLTPAQWAFGDVVLTPADPAEPVLHLPVAIRPAGAAIAVAPAALAATTGAMQVRTLTIRNTGNPTLNWSLTTSGTAPVTPLATATTSSGVQAGYYLGSARGDYWAQAFDVGAQTRVTTLRAHGFTLPATALTSANTPQVAFDVYADAGGVPAGAPQGFGAVPLWHYANAVGATTGITTTGANLQLNLQAAAVAPTPLDLAPGRYWFMAYPTISGLGNATPGNAAWSWRTSAAAPLAAAPRRYSPWDDPSSWQSDGAVVALSALVQGTVDCTQPAWVAYGTTAGALDYDAASPVAVTFDATGLAPGTYRATLCVASNAAGGVAAVPLQLDVPSQRFRRRQSDNTSK